MYSKNISIVEYLLQAKAHIHLGDINNWTPLHHASFVGNLKMTKLLVDKGSKIDQKNNDNKTSYDIAVDKNHGTITKYFIEKMPKSTNSSDCEICCEPRNGIFVFLPCYHSLSCETCCKKIQNMEPPANVCPCCRQSVKGYTKVYVQ